MHVYKLVPYLTSTFISTSNSKRCYFLVNIKGLKNYNNIKIFIFGITGKVIISDKKENSIHLKIANARIYFAKFFINKQNKIITKKL